MRHHRVLRADQRMVGDRAVGHARVDEHPALAVAVIVVRPSRRRSTSESGCSTPPFIRSSRLVPPARYLVPGVAPA